MVSTLDGMKLLIFGLSISSSWRNGHATLWRGLCGALIRRGHEVHFFERDVAYYALHRDLTKIPGGRLHLYSSWDEVRKEAADQLRDADVAIVTSYCPGALQATDLALGSQAGVKCFYDLDTPVTLDRLKSGEPVEYIGPRGLRDFDLVLSYTGYPRIDFIEHRYSDDPTNCWIPNLACAQAMLRSAGFEILDHPEEEVLICRKAKR